MKLKKELMPTLSVFDGLREEDGWVVPTRGKFGTYYRRHAESLADVLPFCENRKVAVQAGGHMGAYPRWLSPHFEVVYTFEPNPEFFRCLSLNASFGNVYPMRAVLSHRSGPRNVGEWRVGEGDGPTPGFALDDLRLTSCDLICLDVEGHERYALIGASSTIYNHKPVILMEEAFPEFGWLADYKEACNILRGWDYQEVGRCGADLIWKYHG